MRLKRSFDPGFLGLCNHGSRTWILFVAFVTIVAIQGALERDSSRSILDIPLRDHPRDAQGRPSRSLANAGDDCYGSRDLFHPNVVNISQARV